MTHLLQIIENVTQKLQAEITRLQGKVSFISDNDIELLVRLSQRAALLCRELWTACHEENHSRGVAPTPGGASVPDWLVTIHSGDLVEINIPLLLPKRTCPDATFITEPLEILLSAYSATLPRFHRCYVLFRHIYGSELAVRDIRDHDNTESRKILNVIERYLLISDSGYYCTNIHQTTQGEETKTVILLASSLNHLTRGL